MASNRSVSNIGQVAAAGRCDGRLSVLVQRSKRRYLRRLLSKPKLMLNDDCFQNLVNSWLPNGFDISLIHLMNSKKLANALSSPAFRCTVSTFGYITIFALVSARWYQMDEFPG